MAETVNPETGELQTSVLRTVPKSIIKARIAVMKEAHNVEKTGRNTFHNYDYASDFDVLTLVQPAMAKNGLALEVWPEEVTGPDDNGNMWVRFAMQWQHESGECADPIPWYGVAQDRDKQGRMGDKWFNKAATAAEKYFLLKQFHIPAGKDVDPDKAVQEANPPYQGNAKPAQQPARTATAKPGAAQQSAETMKIEAPEKPGPIPVPEPPDGKMGGVWQVWASVLAGKLDKAEAVADVDAWLAENDGPIKQLESFGQTGPKYVERLKERANNVRHRLAQAPLEEDDAA